MSWQLNAQLEKDTVTVGDFPLSRVLIMNDAQYPWVILVPRVEGVTEAYELQAMEQQQLLQESSLLSMWLMRHFNGDKLNVAALGNVVSQLHVHHVVRFKSDPAWPAPVWGKLPAQPYTTETVEAFAQQLAKELKLQAV
ncbi:MULTISPECIES: HIT domain-containing protein [Gammaproteobacteria]|uniref:HIT domain-containing protein n=1 Tax=Gammaproteobacteria TaxID=1236 RepID=UPI000DCFF9EE|nr:MULTISPECIES: HIT domain-containing protein [Gammaproteobacteria]RTE86855.1 HIT domain-containing protein [Aliidiomarina sp. B3213]TCZ93356.1 HIT domain-containing protein [Lysobacter sp. N42]